ncbi:methyl-accepting chemotaxis protein [Natrinema soli]|uniref:Methyl-accepting chemotaxis protein n=1 Tax=Natrinema soli TaxID=1930624 RepID=A0ABD5T156_9EURY|nr:methyl-accepting chemotaxis protein [Natrinema soli]
MDFARRLVPKAIRRRYAVKFGIALLILGLSVGLIGYGATAGITNQVEDRVQTDHAASAGQEAQSLQMWNEQNEHTIGTIARSDVVASDDPAAIENRFLDWKEHLDTDTFDISYVDTANETVLASTSDSVNASTDGSGDTSLSQFENVPTDAYGSATESVPWVSDTYTAAGEFDQTTAVITYVQHAAESENRSIVYTANIEAYANQLQQDEGVTTMVVDGDDEVMLDNQGYGENHETLGLAYGGDSAVLTDARTEGASTRQVSGSDFDFDFGSLETAAYDFDENEYVTSSARVFGTDWVVVTHEPSSQALGYVTSINQYGLSATVLGVLMIGMVGAVLGRNTAVSIDRLTDKAGQMEAGNLDVDLETKRIDNIGRLYDGFDSMRVALREQIEEAEAAREEAERERERVQQINGHLEEKAAEYSDVMEAAADGDLTARMEADGENESMAEIAEDFNEMLEEIEQTVAELNRFATDVATASEQVTASSEEVRSASQQVTGSIQEISDGADRQNESLQSVNQEMSGLSTTTEEIAASSNEVADIAERTVDTGRDGQEAAQAAITAMDEIEGEAGDAVSEIRRLEEEVQQIDELINTISEIARQTNMLALNANIEASRSAGGSDDEGFSVVAKEVKALSEDVAEAADEAEDRLEAIRERTEQSAVEVEGTSADIEDASEQVEEAVHALEEIADLAQQTNVGVQEISAATEEQAASTQEVVAMVDDAATISEETTSEAENVAAAAEEQTTALTEVTQSASNLSQQAAQLSEALDRFDTEVDRDDVDLESMVEIDTEPAAAESTFEVDTEATDGSDDENRGITFDTADDPSDTDSDDPLTFDDAADETLEADPTDSAAETTDVDQLAADALESDTDDEAFETDPANRSFDADPADDPVEPADTEPDQAGGDESPADGQRDGDTGEIGAEEILGIEERDDGATDIGTSDTTDGSPGETDPLAEETADPLADTTETADPLAEETAAADPLADDSDASAPLEDERDTTAESGDDDVDTSAGFEPTGDSATDDDTVAQSLDPVDDGSDGEDVGAGDSGTDLEQGSTAGDDGDTESDELMADDDGDTKPDESTAEDDATERADDDTESTESDDVFTFGTASDEDDE